MVLLGQTLNELWTLDYDKIPLWKVQFLSITLMWTSCLNSCRSFRSLTNLPKCKTWTKTMMAMLGVNWSQLIIKHLFGLSFKKVCCSGHLLLQPWFWARNQGKGLQTCRPRVKPGSYISCSWECRRVWSNEPPHSQVNSHFRNWNPNGLLNLQRAFIGVKIHWIENFLISLERF